MSRAVGRVRAQSTGKRGAANRVAFPASSDACRPLLKSLFGAATFGFYYNDAHKKCELCIPGTYRALPGSLKDAGTGDVHTAEDDLAGSRLCQDW